MGIVDNSGNNGKQHVKSYMYYAWEITDVLSDHLTGRGKKKGEGVGRPEINWERQVEKVMKQKNLTLEDAVNRQIWRQTTENQ